jgi:hypothetical protein
MSKTLVIWGGFHNVPAKRFTIPEGIYRDVESKMTEIDSFISRLFIEYPDWETVVKGYACNVPNCDCGGVCEVALENYDSKAGKDLEKWISESDA